MRGDKLEKAKEAAIQAEARCRGKIDRGAEFAQSALEMAALKRRLSKKS